MDVEIRIPTVGESVQTALLAEWFVAEGARVEAGDALLLLETDKVTLEVEAEAAGTVAIGVKAGETVKPGQVVGQLKGAEASAPAPPAPEAAPKPDPPPTPEAAPQAASAPSPPQGAAKALLAAAKLDPAAVAASGPGGRLTRGDVLLHLEETDTEPPPSSSEHPTSTSEPPPSSIEPPAPDGATTRVPLSPLRRRLAQRLLESQRTTATLTTFNEVDMGRVMDLRARHQEAFRARHGVGLGITSFFVVAAARALGEFPAVNAFLEADDLVLHHHVHVGVAVGAERGLVVPVIRHVERLGIAGVEAAVAGFVAKVKGNRLELSDLEGGTFSVTNGGVFGSLLSTPILNPPQSAILGLHKVEDRPVAVDGQVVIRPRMYVALSYDHRVVDGRGAVSFLARIKALVEEPELLLLEV